MTDVPNYGNNKWSKRVVHGYQFYGELGVTLAIALYIIISHFLIWAINSVG